MTLKTFEPVNGQVHVSLLLVLHLCLHTSTFPSTSLCPAISFSVIFHSFFLFIDVPSVFLPILCSHLIPSTFYPSLTSPSVAPSPTVIELLHLVSSQSLHPRFAVSICTVFPMPVSIHVSSEEISSSPFPVLVNNFLLCCLPLPLLFTLLSRLVCHEN